MQASFFLRICRTINRLAKRVFGRVGGWRGEGREPQGFRATNLEELVLRVTIQEINGALKRERIL
jgi:hypothetical protein